MFIANIDFKLFFIFNLDGYQKYSKKKIFFMFNLFRKIYLGHRLTFNNYGKGIN